jgi:hypothetical protein
MRDALLLWQEDHAMSTEGRLRVMLERIERISYELTRTASFVQELEREVRALSAELTIVTAPVSTT